MNQKIIDAAKEYTGFIPDFEKRPISYSAMKHFAISPMALIEYYTKPFTPSPAMQLGSMVDLLLFTPDEFEKRYTVYEKFEKRKDVDKQKWADMIAQAKEERKTLITNEDIAEAKTIVQAIRNKPAVNELLLSMTQTQEKIYWTDRKTGLKCITVPDCSNDLLCADLKISKDAHPDDWKRYFFGDSELTIQVGFLLQGFASRGKFPEFKNIVVQSSSPYDTSVNPASDETILFCNGKFRKYMDKLKYCIDNKLWGMGYEFHSATEEFIMDVPGWLKTELDSYK